MSKGKTINNKKRAQKSTENSTLKNYNLELTQLKKRLSQQVDNKHIDKDLHKMEKKLNLFDFSFLETEKINTQLENESFLLYLDFLQGE